MHRNDWVLDIIQKERRTYFRKLKVRCQSLPGVKGDGDNDNLKPGSF